MSSPLVRQVHGLPDPLPQSVLLSMAFASGVFLYLFLPAFLAVYFLSPKRWRSLVLAVFSYLFYGFWRPDFVLLMWASTAVDFVVGRSIARAQEHARLGGSPADEGAQAPADARVAGRPGKAWLCLSLAVNLGLLAYFKYFNFGIDSLNAIFAGFDGPALSFAEVVLPVGISFYTFQTLSYSVDIYRGHAQPAKSLGDFMCYVAMFPQLVAGPIVRYSSVADQLQSRTHTLPKFYRGVLSFQSGLAKKILVGDVLGQLADAAFATSDLSPAHAWLGALCYTFQIYFDFSGYSDMAIGLGLMIGFRFPINFDQPYRSVSITDFWRRWHVSLSSFLRDYLYVPLGGNRKGPLRTYVNLSATMLVGGLWHGANWTFIAWGAYQGFWLIVERLMGKRSLFGWLPKAGQVAGTFVIVIFGWVFFRAENLGAAMDYFSAMFGADLGVPAVGELPLRRIHGGALVAGALCLWVFPTTQSLIRSPRPSWALALQGIFWIALLQLHHVSHVPFLYFQF